MSVSTHTEECSRQEVETAANSSIFCILMLSSDNFLHSNQIASREKISPGMKLGSLTVSFYIVVLKNHFSAAGTVPLKEVKTVICLAPAGQGMLRSHTRSLTVFAALNSTIFSNSELRV